MKRFFIRSFRQVVWLATCLIASTELTGAFAKSSQGRRVSKRGSYGMETDQREFSRTRRQKDYRSRQSKVPTSSLAAYLGLVNGIHQFDGAVFAFGADYIYSIDRNFKILGGGLYWSDTTKMFGGSMTISAFTLDGGAAYAIPVGERASIDLGGRLGIVSSSVEMKFDNAYLNGMGLPTNRSVSDILSTIFAGFTMPMDSVILGAQLRLPLFAGSALDGFEGSYFLGSVGIGF